METTGDYVEARSHLGSSGERIFRLGDLAPKSRIDAALGRNRALLTAGPGDASARTAQTVGHVGVHINEEHDRVQEHVAQLQEVLHL